jgi:hypothetical protein
MIPNPCCCASCLIFQDLFDQSGDVLSSYWDVIAGSMTLDSATNTATITGGSEIGPTVTSPTGSAGLALGSNWPDANTSIKFCYADANNHWRLDITGGHTVGVLPALLFELYEVVAGTPTFKGSRYLEDLDEVQAIEACWEEGTRIRIEIHSSNDAVFIWPTTITGGNSFRIEPTDDIDLDGDLQGVIFHKIDGDAPGATNPEICCPAGSCSLCDSSFNDTMQIEALDGPDVGETLVVDRYLLHTSAGGGGLGAHAVGYWNYDYVAGSGASNYSASLDFCVDGNSDSEGRLTINTNVLGPGSGTADFDASDCTGPWDVVINTVTYRITIL